MSYVFLDTSSYAKVNVRTRIVALRVHFINPAIYWSYLISPTTTHLSLNYPPTKGLHVLPIE
jgi:hypothetical protein